MINSRGNNKSFQQITNKNIEVAPSAGFDSGSAMDRKTLKCVAPSIEATSYISLGSSLKNEVRINIEIGRVVTTFTAMSPW